MGAVASRAGQSAGTGQNAFPTAPHHQVDRGAIKDASLAQYVLIPEDLLFQILKDDAVESAALNMQYALSMQYAGSRHLTSTSEAVTWLFPPEGPRTCGGSGCCCGGWSGLGRLFSACSSLSRPWLAPCWFSHSAVTERRQETSMAIRAEMQK